MVSNCVSAATEHRVHTISTIPVQLACMRSDNFTGVSQLKNNLFWACQHTHGKKKLRKKIVRGKKQQKHENYTPEAAWTSHKPVDDLDPPTFQALSCAKKD